MIKVTIGNNLKRDVVLVDENTTLRQCLTDNEIDYSVGTTTIDGAPIPAGGLDKSFADFGITEKCYLLNVVKAANA